MNWTKQQLLGAGVTVVAGAALAGAAVLQLGPQGTAVIATADIPAGQPISPANSRKVAADIAGAQLLDVPEGIASRAISAGSVLTLEDVQGLALEDGRGVLGVYLKPGQFPSTIQPGQKVMLVATGAVAAAAPAEDGSIAPAPAGTWTAEVINFVPDPSNAGAAYIDLKIDAAAAGRIATAASNNELAVVGL